QSCHTPRCPRRSPRHRGTRRGRGRYRRMRTACPEARASLYLCGWNPLRNTRFRVDKKPQRLDRPPAPPHGSRDDLLKSLTLSTFNCLPGAWRGSGGSGCASCLPPVPRLPERSRYISYELTRAGGGDASSSYTVRPGTTPLTRDERFRAVTRLRAHAPG